MESLSFPTRTKIRNAVGKLAFFFGPAYWVNRFVNPLMVQYRPDFHYDHLKLPGYARFYRDWVRGNRINNGGDLVRFYALVNNVRHVLGSVPGDVVELGVYQGHSAALLAALAREANRRTYLYDTFSGFDERDLSGIDGWLARHHMDTSLERVRRFVGSDRTTYVPGFFPESATPASLPERIAVAHIDCDLYEPVKAGLEVFYPRLNSGGLLLVHDYASFHWPGATKAVDEFFADRPEKPILLPDKSGTAAIRKI